MHTNIFIAGAADDAAALTTALRHELAADTLTISSSAALPTRAISARQHLVIAVGSGQDAAADARDVVDVWMRAADDPELPAVLGRIRDFQANIVHRRLPPDTPPTIAAVDTQWPMTARRLAARILAVLGPVPASIDHVGSTSVPGLAATNIVDLQVNVGSLDEFDSREDALLAAGFVNVQRLAPDAPGVMVDNPRGSAGEHARWRKRLYAGTDPGCRVIVHVREVGSPGWRYALLFRDWLTAEPGPRREYEDLKRALARAHAEDANFDAYARSKEDWFNQAYRASEVWAADRGWVPAQMR